MLSFDIWDWDSTVKAATRTLDVSASSLGIAVIGRLDECVRIIYDVSGTVYIRDTYDQCRSWSDAVSVATGSKPCIAYSPEDGVEIIAYIDANNHVRVRRRLGETDNYGDPIAVDDNITATSVAIERLTGTRSGLWVMAITTSGGSIEYYRSANGSEWNAT